jgi:molybdate transport system substrate-binding protein
VEVSQRSFYRRLILPCTDDQAGSVLCIERRYGKQTLLTYHLWEQLSTKFVLGKDVRQVLTYVETGNADAGLVYATDAKASGRVRIVVIASESSHDPIDYP